MQCSCNCGIVIMVLFSWENASVIMLVALGMENGFTEIVAGGGSMGQYHGDSNMAMVRGV